MSGHVRTKVRSTVGVVGLASVIVCVSVVIQMQRVYGAKIVMTADVHPAPVGIILGASVKRDGTPSDALHDRLRVGARLYKDGRVTRLLVTGDDGQFHIDEVSTMKRVLMEEGIPAGDIAVDGHGYRTYESCKRAVQVFGITEAIIVTQRFHLPRALYLCSHLGMQAQGVAADLQTYERIIFFTVRDWFSSLKAWWDVNIYSPVPPVVYQDTSVVP